MPVGGQEEEARRVPALARALPAIMPLFVGDQRIDLSLSAAQLVERHPGLEERAKALTCQPARTVGPKGFLYVQQREFAVTAPNDSSVYVLGSDDATTCHLVVLRDTGSGATCLTHCDGSDTEAEVSVILGSVKSFSSKPADGRLEVHLVGGFNDDKGLSQNLTSDLLRAFDNQQDEIHLVTFCVTELNDMVKNGFHFPVIYGIGVNVRTAEIFSASIQDHGPDENIRSARMLAGGAMISLYDAKTEQLYVGPYHWMPFPFVNFWLEQEDEQLLKNLSTSPLAEPPHFVSHIRATLTFLQEHPFPGNSLFADKKPRVYKKNKEGLWERVLPDKM
ncbi:protein N-terminal asparagine amidohydrolase [Rhinatrema bivittatum]|uniref:protein N-terminal asparagine amidohydrolase n=1 Tax=Rhinatrema bivittatum TaxID=194408 RepID=UPI00112E5706|nr:protein N-terminal asparagine amidohydrolase [Rhinatrema bivittatum]